MAEPFAAALKRYIRAGYRAPDAMKAAWHDVRIGRVERPRRPGRRYRRAVAALPGRPLLNPRRNPLTAAERARILRESDRSGAAAEAAIARGDSATGHFMHGRSHGLRRALALAPPVLFTRGNPVRALSVPQARTAARQYGQRPPPVGYCVRLTPWLELCRDRDAYYLVSATAPPARGAVPTPVGTLRRFAWSTNARRGRAGRNPALGLPVPRAAAGLKVETRLVRSRGYRPDRLPTITSPADVAALARKLPDSDRERTLALYLNAQNRVVGVQQLSVGARSATLVPIDAVIRTALLANAAGFVLVHNHPSGDPTPSRPDADIYRRLKAAAELVDIRALDAVVVANGQYRSLEEQGGA